MPTNSIHVIPSEMPPILTFSEQNADGDDQREGKHGMGDAVAENKVYNHSILTYFCAFCRVRVQN